MKDITIVELLAFEEGFMEKPYHCSEGYPTIGIGQKIGRKNDPLHHYTFTVNMEVAEAMLIKEIEVQVIPYILEKRNDLSYSTEGWTQARYTILLSMAYQLGTSGLSKFKNMWAAIQRGDWQEAAVEALDSRWAVQTPNRADRHAEVLRTGVWDCYEGLIK